MKRFHNVAKQRILFLKQLAVLLQSGLPLLRGLQLLGQRSDKSLAMLCYRLQERLARGSSLAQAMAAESSFFPPLVSSMVRAGEESGSLTQILSELATYYAKQEKMRSFLIKTTWYPCFLLCITLVVALFFSCYVLPFVATAYASLGVRPTGMLDAILALQSLLIEQYMMLGMAASCLLVFTICMRRQIMAALQKQLWKMSCYRLIYEIRFCKLLSLLLESGLAIIYAVELTGSAVDHVHYRRELQLLGSRLRKGMDITAAAAGSGKLFSPLTLDFISVGVATGCLPQMLDEAAAVGEEMLREKLDKVKTLLAPLLLLAVALVIAAMLCAVIGPLLEMVTVLPE